MSANRRVEFEYVFSGETLKEPDDDFNVKTICYKQVNRKYSMRNTRTFRKVSCSIYACSMKSVLPPASDGRNSFSFFFLYARIFQRVTNGTAENSAKADHVRSQPILSAVYFRRYLRSLESQDDLYRTFLSYFRVAQNES